MKNIKLPKTFEARLERLQAIVATMEKGDMALEQSVEMYREGMLLSKACREQLDKAQHEVTLFTQDVEKPFSLNDAENNGVTE